MNRYDTSFFYNFKRRANELFKEYVKNGKNNKGD